MFLRGMLLISFVIFAVLSHASCSCDFRIGQPRPVMWKELGFKKLLIPKSSDVITLEDKDEVHVQCATYVNILGSSFSTTPQDNSIVIYCRNDYRYYKDKHNAEHMEYNNYNNYETLVQCGKGGVVSLYESFISLPNCFPYASYGIGMSISSTDQIISAKSCFDVTSMKAKYVAFTMSNEGNLEELSKVTTKKNRSSFSLDLPVVGLNVFWKAPTGSDFHTYFELMRQRNVFLSLFDFEYAGLIQDVDVRSELGQYQDMFQTIWWKNLRNGIWKIYWSALREQSKVNAYEIYAGTSGTLTVPTNDCKKEEKFQLKVDQKTLIAPNYIWNLVVPKNNITLEKSVIIIGYNSPYETQLNETLFCRDMCSEIGWLNFDIFKKLRQLSSVGTIHCCHPEEVADVLENLPFTKKEFENAEEIAVPQKEHDSWNVTDNNSTVAETNPPSEMDNENEYE